MTKKQDDHLKRLGVHLTMCGYNPYTQQGKLCPDCLKKLEQQT